MCKNLICLAGILLILCLTGGQVFAGLAFPDPVGGWTYIYNGDAAANGAVFTSLDGTWDHDNSGDAWDGLEIGSGAPGGVSILTEDDTTFLRLQDTGDPREYGIPDPSNRKLYFCHSITNEIGEDMAATIIDDGVALTFRARIPTTPPLDDLYRTGAGAVAPWPAGGNGYLGHHTGKDIFGIHQSSDTSKISFALSLASDSDYLEGKSGLTMNTLDGPEPSGVVDLEDSEGILNIVELDPTVWHEFWVVIEPDITEVGTYIATIYVDGDITAPSVFSLTAGTGDNEYDDTYLALGAGSTTQDGAVDVDFFAYKQGAVHPPGAKVMAQKPSPMNGSVVEDRSVTLSWKAGDYVASHDVYFADNFEDVNDDTAFLGNQDQVSYGPVNLDPGQTYYWRIDEVNDVNPDSPWRGTIWSFAASNYIVLEDFEDYNDYPPDEVWNTWIDGYGDPMNGSTAGYPDPDFNFDEHYLEGVIVNNGDWSMPLFYDNTAGISEVTRALSGSDSDWTREGVVTLTMFYYGDAANAAEPMYAVVDGSAVAANDDLNAAVVTEWTRWDIPLADIAAQGVNLADVGSITLGFGNKANPTAGGGSGYVFFDDIRLYRPEPQQ